jgi:hypothetical protein
MKQSAVEFLLEQIKKDSNLRLRGFDIDRIGNQAKEIEKQQQDELAIEFVKWAVSPETSDLLHDLEIVGEIDINITPEKLLEIYKKEKGL